MIIQYQDHELASIEIVRTALPHCSYTGEEISEICDLIAVTRLPQRPSTIPGYILCDADMDNLGRDDFYIQSFRLKLELEMNGISTTNLKMWLSNLVRFLEEHVYYTTSSIELRLAKKMQNLADLKEIVMLY